MTFITHGDRVSVVSDVRERVRDFRITFALYVKKIFISWVCLCVTRNRCLQSVDFFYIRHYVQPCLSKNPKYTFYTIKSSLTLAYECYFKTKIQLIFGYEILKIYLFSVVSGENYVIYVVKLYINVILLFHRIQQS